MNGPMKCVVLVLLDFSNAFGSVDHNKLLQVSASYVHMASVVIRIDYLNDWK